MKNLIGEHLTYRTEDSKLVDIIYEDVKNFTSNEEEHTLLHAAHTIDAFAFNDRIEALEAFNKKLIIGAIVIGITTIVVAATKDKVTEKVNRFKEKRKARTEMILEDTAE